MMYEVFVWVPSKGWKLLRRTSNLRDAIDKAVEFTPLEVKLTDKVKNRTWHSGQCHTPLRNTKQLDQIERLNDSLSVPTEDKATAWTDDGKYHAPKSFHPAICAGCTTDESKHGKSIPQ